MRRRRSPNEVEKDVYTIKFLFPVFIFVFLLLIPLSLFITSIILTVNGISIVGLPLLYAFFLITPIIILEFILVNTSWAKISNRRFYGYLKYVFGRHPFSYKLDEIVGVELQSFFFVRWLKVKVSHGNGDSEKVKLMFVRNGNDVYFALVKMINSVRCDSDVLFEVLEPKENNESEAK